MLIALLFGICVAALSIHLHVDKKIDVKALSVMFALAIIGGLAIANFDVLKRWKGLGIEVETARNEIKEIRTDALKDINKQVDDQKNSISVLMRSANEMSDKLEKQKALAEDVVAHLVSLQSAVPARNITANQRDLFLEALASKDNISPKIPIKVLVTSKDPETQKFAQTIRSLLDEADYKTEEGKGIGTVSAPPSSFVDDQKRIPDLIAVYSNSSGYSDMARTGFGSVMIMNATPEVIAKGDKSHPRVYRYTENPNDILLGITAILKHIGVSTHSIYGDGVLQPGEVAFYIPSQMERANP